MNENGWFPSPGVTVLTSSQDCTVPFKRNETGAKVGLMDDASSNGIEMLKQSSKFAKAIWIYICFVCLL